MAIYHFSAKVISRSAGSSAVASAAYRSASRLHDQRLDRSHDFTNKAGVVHSEVILPNGAPERLGDRSTLWNEVEATELRKDAQLSREVEFAIPRELDQQQGIALARNFVRDQFVDRGMIADLNVHWDIGADGLPKPHAHVMLTMRELGEEGFGSKVRDWNKAELVQTWRLAWETHVNERLASLDIDARIDHRSLEAQGIELEPQNKIGPAASRMSGHGLEAERVAEHADIAQRNGERIIANPNVALDAITHQQATFTGRDLAMFVHRHSDGKEQFDAALSAVRGSPDLIALGKDGRGEDRFTSREMLATEERLQRACERLSLQHNHGVPAVVVMGSQSAAGTRGLLLGQEQQDAVAHITRGSDIALVIGYAGTGKSTMLGVAREAWEDAGYAVRGAALSGIAAEGLENGSGITSRTIASLEHQWGQGRELLSSRDVLVIDEAGMVGTRQMERVLSHAADAGAKVVLVGDPQQLQAIEAGAAFRAIHERHGGVEITEVRRQHEDWQQDATRHLATGRTGQAIHAYEEAGMVHVADTREAARSDLIDRWDRDRHASPGDTRIILTHTNDEVRALNEAARDRMRAAGELGEDVSIKAERGERQFASGDRIMFLRNERSLGVKNGTLGTVEHVSAQSMAVRTDDDRHIAFDTKDYAHVDHGYAATIHKAQGMTVDRAYVLATPGMDSHGAYVGMSRHRDGVDLHYGRDDFANRDQLVHTLSRERGKDMASDYKPEHHPSTEFRRAFAERRGITFRERVAEITRQLPERAKSIFANFRPQTHKVEVLPSEQTRLPDQRRAVERYARALDEVGQMREHGATVLPHQRAALEKAGQALDAIRPHAAADLSSALQRQPEFVREAANGRSQGAIRAMQLEAEIRANPTLRADRFVSDWQRLGQARLNMQRDGNSSGARQVSGRMADMAKSLGRDAQVESLLRNRKIELGLNARSGGGIGHQLTEYLGLGRGRGIGIGM